MHFNLTHIRLSGSWVLLQSLAVFNSLDFGLQLPTISVASLMDLPEKLYSIRPNPNLNLPSLQRLHVDAVRGSFERSQRLLNSVSEVCDTFVPNAGKKSCQLPEIESLLQNIVALEFTATHSLPLAILTNGSSTKIDILRNISTLTSHISGYLYSDASITFFDVEGCMNKKGIISGLQCIRLKVASHRYAIFWSYLPQNSFPVWHTMTPNEVISEKVQLKSEAHELRDSYRCFNTLWTVHDEVKRFKSALHNIGHRVRKINGIILQVFDKLQLDVTVPARTIDEKDQVEIWKNVCRDILVALQLKDSTAKAKCSPSL